jgi:hypothetical protein
VATTTNNATELFGQAARSFESAIQTGIKLQEESVKCVTDMLGNIGSPQKWQKKAQDVMEDMVGASQKNMDEAVQVMNDNAKVSMDLLKKAFESRPADANEAQSRAMNLWETSLGMLRNNTEAVLRANTRVVEAWTEMAKKMNGEHFEKMAAMAEKVTQGNGH